jgi:hypothetical protein
MKNTADRTIFAYDVYLNKKHLDTVFYGHREPVDEVYRSLVGHDGYDSAINVRLRRTPKMKSF